jgi:hypothetical protein
VSHQCIVLASMARLLPQPDPAGTPLGSTCASLVGWRVDSRRASWSKELRCGSDLNRGIRGADQMTTLSRKISDMFT